MIRIRRGHAGLRILGAMMMVTGNDSRIMPATNTIAIAVNSTG